MVLEYSISKEQANSSNFVRLLDNPERDQHLPSPEPVLVGEAVQAIENRVGIFLSMQDVVEIYAYTEFPEGVVQAGVEQGEGLALAGGNFFSGEVCGEGQFQGRNREEG